MSFSSYSRCLCADTQALENRAPSLRKICAEALHAQQQQQLTEAAASPSPSASLSPSPLPSLSASSLPLSSTSPSSSTSSSPLPSLFLPRVAFLGRSLSDYSEMFALPAFPPRCDGNGLGVAAGCPAADGGAGVYKRVLDVAAGSASFAAEVAPRGVGVTAVDPRYNLTVDALDKLSAQDQEASFTALAHNPHCCRTDGEGLVALRAQRELTRRYFLNDYAAGVACGRYRAAALPHLPFADAEFDLALCGNFLFLYAHLHGEEFHRQAVDELLRVAREVRIYPLQGLDSAAPPFLAALLAHLRRRKGLTLELLPVQSPVLLGQSQVLVLRQR